MDHNYKNIILNMFKEEKKILLIVIFIAILDLNFIIRAIIIPGIIAKYSNNINYLLIIFCRYFLLYLIIYMIRFYFAMLLKLNLTSYLSNLLFIKILKGRNKNINNINSSLFTDIYAVIDETAQLFDKVFSILPLIVTFISIIFFIFKEISFINGLSFSIIIFSIVFLSIFNAKDLVKNSDELNIKKTKMINLNEDINKNILTVISFDNFKEEEKNIRTYTKNFINTLIKTLKSSLFMKSSQLLILSLYFLISIYILKNKITSELFIKYILIFLSLIQYLSTKGRSISELFMHLGKLNNGTANIKNSLNFKDIEIKRSIKTDEVKSKINILKIENINFKFSNKVIYQNFNLKVESNKIIILKGEIGSGKSTLLRIIFGIYNTDSGNIYLNNLSILNENIQDWRKNIHFVSQHPILFNRTIEENLFYPNSKRTQKIDNIIKKLELDDIFEKILSRKNIGIGGEKLSGGQKQIISIFRVILDSKPIILLDEPTSDLDPQNRKKIYRMIEYLKSQNKTVIIATHDEELMKLGDEIININN